VKIDAVLEELKIPREVYRVIMLMPLVYVAWADGKILSPERKFIMSIAEERGLLDYGVRGCLERLAATGTWAATSMPIRS